MKEKEIIDFLFELTHLRHIKHEGWRYLGITHPESVADHSLSAAQIAYMLAKMEGCKDPFKACAMAVFHDIGECRIGDLHKIANRYVEADEEGAVRDQTEKLGSAGKEILNLWKEIEDKSSEAGIIAKDADLLEQAFTAKQYIEKGHTFAQDWIDNVSKHLMTKSAKKILEIMKKTDSNDWWQGLKNFDKRKRACK